jgi:hypothetical protein
MGVGILFESQFEDNVVLDSNYQLFWTANEPIGRDRGSHRNPGVKFIVLDKIRLQKWVYYTNLSLISSS